MKSLISKSQFKAKALEYFRRVEADGEPIIITDNGKPALEVRRYTAPTHSPLDELRDTVLSYTDPFGPIGEDDWEALK